MEELCSHWVDFHEIWRLNIFRKSVRKIQASVKYNKNNRYFTRRPTYIYVHISVSSSSNEKCFRQTFQGKSKYTSIIISFQMLCLLWDSLLQYGRNGQAAYDNIILRMHFACWITKAIYKGTEFVIIIVLPLQQWLWERYPILCYTYVASLVYQTM